MNKWLVWTIRLGALIALFGTSLPLVTHAAATQFKSSNFGLESVIFGGTGILHTAYSSIPPVITAGPTVANISTTNATVEWATDKPSNSVVIYGLVSGVYDQQAGQLINTTATTHTVMLGNLKKGTTYFYKVSSGDVTGNTTQSVEKQFTTDPGDITPPIVTAGPVITTDSSTAVTVTWTTNEISNSLVEYGLRVVDENSVGHSEELTLLHKVQVSGLQASQQYLLRIKSRDASSNLYTGTTLHLETLNAPSITGVKITDITLNSALVQWTTTTPSTSTVNYGPTTDLGQKIEDTSSYSQNHLVRLSGLISGTSYYVQLSGNDQSANHLTSDQYLFKTVVLPVISDVTVTDVTSSAAALHWKSSSDIDEFIRTEITKTVDKTLLGKKATTGNDKLVSDHTFLLSELESGTEYTISIIGKDVFGNQALAKSIVVTTQPDLDPPVIQNIKSDTSVDLGGKQTVQVLVSFDLSELGKAYLEYGDGATGSYTQKVQTDTDLSLSKFMVIAGLQPGHSYHYHIVATDRAGNVATSADYLVLAPTKSVSLLDLIFGQVQQNFGWLGNGLKK
jgi:hypothetical protein